MPASPDAVLVRPAVPADRPEWLRMRNTLWPDANLEGHGSAIDDYFAGTAIEVIVYVSERPDRSLGGFIEISLRPYADGFDSSPVPYIEGWYVDPDLRRQHVGAALVAAAEHWARERGHREMASDCLLDNTVSLQAHLNLGFAEVERAIHLRKDLKG